MTPYTYTKDLPSTDPKAVSRMGYKLPRSILLPPYLSETAYFKEFMDAIDTVFSSTVDIKLEALENLRNVWWTNPHTEKRIDDGLMLAVTDWRFLDRVGLIKQVNLLGLHLKASGLVSDTGYQALTRFVGLYWLSKGTANTVDFLNFCIGSNLTIQKLWTQDYVNFYPEGDPLIGSTIYGNEGHWTHIFKEGDGTWYPTTHVLVEASGSSVFPDPVALTELLYEILNYNLVVRIGATTTYNVVDADDNAPANILACGLHTDITYDLLPAL